MSTSVISPARGMPVTRTVAARSDINRACSPSKPAQSAHAHTGCAGQRAHRGWGLVDDDVVAIPGQFVVGRSAFDFDVQPGHRRMLAGPAGEKLRRQQQFGFTEHGALHPLADLGGLDARPSCGGAGQRDRGLQRGLQGVVTHVADKHRPTGGQQIQGVVDDLGQISRVGESTGRPS